MKKLNVGKKYTINRNIMSQAGMLYNGAQIRILEIKEGRVSIEDMMGRIFYVNEDDITY
tara:strand:- start:222 stop:398 length:177 start_codon:yes stop_codon:yes gene_type:complete